MNIEITISIIATVLAVASFGGEAWRLWRDRPRLIFFVTPVTFTNVPKLGELKMMRVMVCNVGYRPIVLTKFVALSDRSSFVMGINDEPAAIFGKEDLKFPMLLEPGKTLKIHPMTIAALKRNAEKPEKDKENFDPYKYFSFIDSFGRFYSLDAENVRWHLQLLKQRKRPHWWQKPGYWFRKKAFFRRAKRQLRTF